MNVPLLHNLLLGLIVICSVILGIAHVFRAQEISEIFLAATGASFGHAVGYQVAVERRARGVDSPQ